MTLHRFRLTLAASALGAALLVAPVAAEAQSVRDQVVANLTAAMKAAGAKDVTWAAIEGDDARFTLKDIKAVIQAEGNATTLTAAKATYVGAKPSADGGYSAAEIAIDGLAMKESDTDIAVTAMKITNYVGQPAAKVVETKGLGDRFDRIELTGIKFAGTNNQTIPIASAVVTAGGHVDGVPRKAGLEVKGFVLAVDPNDPEMQEVAALGYKELAIEISAGGNWDEKAQRLSIETISVKGKDVGALTFAFALGGVSNDAVKALQAAKDDNAKQLEILQGFSIETISVRFENASIVDRVLDAQAKAQGTKREQYVTGLAAAVPLMIGALNNKPFEKKVSDAVGAFLKAPKSLSVVAKPAQPVPVAQVVGTAMVAPQTLPSVLAVDIQANK